MIGEYTCLPMCAGTSFRVPAHSGYVVRNVPPFTLENGRRRDRAAIQLRDAYVARIAEKLAGPRVSALFLPGDVPGRG